MKPFLVGILFAFVSLPALACTKPSGTFVGGGSGVVFSAVTGQTLAGASFVMTLTVNSLGNGTISEEGKSTGASPSAGYRFSRSGNFTSTFSTTTCRGTVTYQGRTFLFTSANVGKTINFIDYTPDTLITGYTVILNKVN